MIERLNRCILRRGKIQIAKVQNSKIIRNSFIAFQSVEPVYSTIKRQSLNNFKKWVKKPNQWTKKLSSIASSIELLRQTKSNLVVHPQQPMQVILHSRPKTRKVKPKKPKNYRIAYVGLKYSSQIVLLMFFKKNPNKLEKRPNHTKKINEALQKKP